MRKITAVKYDKNGEIETYQLNTGEMVTKDKAFELVHSGEISGAILGVNEYGRRVIYELSENVNENGKKNLLNTN
ncbi:hypothetical protein Q428_13855 [Fervidicella metallireducens AeB]|uniref:DUF3892 domain-containing protein n=1 Tax=Fervidicella metallireducens AeB TaxID=1403537 RepID=A0A017RRE1_9CLOT|nr:DUF3892 domain-containing protein [Fervidicella metallireducens]EYE87338.1 hypothetical protein Q428_13855 [Fervidicella metallireducens AeB]